MTCPKSSTVTELDSGCFSSKPSRHLALLGRREQGTRLWSTLNLPSPNISGKHSFPRGSVTNRFCYLWMCCAEALPRRPLGAAFRWGGASQAPGQPWLCPFRTTLTLLSYLSSMLLETRQSAFFPSSVTTITTNGLCPLLPGRNHLNAWHSKRTAVPGKAFAL